MWREYADSYQGMCIEYNLKEFNIGFGWVKYTSDPYTWDRRGPFDIRGNISRSTMVKGEKYRNEHEVRHCHFYLYGISPDLGGELDEYVSAPLPTHIYIGYRASTERPDQFNQLIDYCESKNIPFTIVTEIDTEEG